MAVSSGSILEGSLPSLQIAFIILIETTNCTPTPTPVPALLLGTTCFPALFPTFCIIQLDVLANLVRQIVFNSCFSLHVPNYQPHNGFSMGLQQWFSTRDYAAPLPPPRSNLAMTGDILGYHPGEQNSWGQVVRAEDTTPHPAVHRAAAQGRPTVPELGIFCRECPPKRCVL